MPQTAMLQSRQPMTGERFTSINLLAKTLCEEHNIFCGVVAFPVDGGFEVFCEPSDSFTELESLVVAAQLDVHSDAFMVTQELKGPFKSETAVRNWLLSPGKAAVIGPDAGIYVYGEILPVGDSKLDRLLAKVKARNRRATIFTA
ncbi:MAG: hypothetical protein US81_C0029G0004 [Parcubacteria group bacterium GW2011_GWE2_38_18]|nr:MAG: hypothetical protein US81_C0029G0004 [Parcubacteria group bacterium GW2011_GWE2_38_18]